MKLKLKLSAFLLGATFVLAACGGAGDKDNANDQGDQGGEAPVATAQAEELYQQNCASCHGQNLEGVAGPKLQNIGSKYSKDEIQNIILNGQGAMPKGLLQGDEAAAVAQWLSEKK